jgi:hypothetical protein
VVVAGSGVVAVVVATVVSVVVVVVVVVSVAVAVVVAPVLGDDGVGLALPPAATMLGDGTSVRWAEWVGDAGAFFSTIWLGTDEVADGDTDGASVGSESSAGGCTI